LYKIDITHTVERGGEQARCSCQRYNASIRGDFAFIKQIRSQSVNRWAEA